MREDAKRIQIFDIAKGISIILMTIGRYDFTEIYPNLKYFNDIAMLFKMPTFIFISGYLIGDRLSFQHYLCQKIDGLIKPLVAFLISLTLLQIIFYLIFSDEITFKDGAGPVLNLARTFYHGSFDAVNVSFWFIMSLFLGQITLKGFLEIKHFNKPLNYIFFISFVAIFLILDAIKIPFYWTEHIPTFFTYLFLGYSFKKISIRYFNGTSFFYSKKMILFPILFLITLFTLKKLNIEINYDLAGLQFNYHYLLFVSLLGVFSVIYLCRYIEKIPKLGSILVYCSKASFFILAYHIFIKDVYSVLFDLKSYNPLFHTFLVIVNIVLCCLIYMVIKKIPFVRIFFYPIKVIVLIDAEINRLKSMYIGRFIQKKILR